MMTTLEDVTKEKAEKPSAEAAAEVTVHPHLLGKGGPCCIGTALWPIGPRDLFSRAGSGSVVGHI